jgi:4-amino-4-deoxy-L-arabinose transferase-like glycosyltransferase
MRGAWRALLGESGFRRRDSWLLSTAIVTLLAVCSLLVGISSVPVTDRDEPRFAQASRQMAESDRLADWIVPRVGDEIRLKKPPLIYWVQAPTVLALTGGEPRDDAIWMYRLPSAVAAWLAALATLWLGRRMLGGNTGLLAACLLVVAPVVAVDCHMARADELLLATTTLAMCVLWTLWSRHRADPSARGGLPLGTVVLFWGAVALGVLAKGPVTPFVAGSTALVCAAARRDWRFLWRLRPVTGALVLVALALPWIWLAGREVGWDTLRAALDKEVFQRAKEGAEGHAAPPGYYLVTIFAFFFPGSLLVLLGFERAAKRAFALRPRADAGLLARLRARFASVRGRDAELFLVAWIVPTWLAFELVVTKFPHYILPVYPALALLCARLALGGARALPKPLNAGDRFGMGAWLAVGCGLALAGPALLAWLAATGRVAPALPSWPELVDSGAFVLAIAALVTLAACALLVAAFRRARAGALAVAIALAIPATALAEAALFSAWIPNARWIWNTPRIVGIVAADCGITPSDERFPRIGGVGYGEDSLLWTTRARLDRLGQRVDAKTKPGIDAWCEANPGGYLVVPRASVAEFAARGVVVAELVGFNYSDGDPVDHAIVRIAPGR